MWACDKDDKNKAFMSLPNHDLDFLSTHLTASGHYKLGTTFSFRYLSAPAMSKSWW